MKRDYRSTLARLRRVDPDAFARVCAAAEAFLAVHDGTTDDVFAAQVSRISRRHSETN